MNEDEKRFWDVFIGIVTMFLTVATIFVGISQFDKQEKSASKLEFKRELWKKQLDDYNRMMGVAGVLSSKYTDDSTFTNNRQEFEQMYWGAMTMTEDSVVTDAIINTREAIRDYPVGQKSNESLDRIKVNVNILDSVCSKALKESWKKLDSD